MKAVTIIIGRSAGGKAIDPVSWGKFQGKVIYVLSTLGNYFRTLPSIGQMQGTVEENVTIFGQVHDANIDTLKNHLRYIGGEFNQDGVLLIFGEAEYLKVNVEAGL